MKVFVYRKDSVDEHGDPVDGSSLGSLIGELDVIMGSPSSTAVVGRGDVADTTGLFGAPTNSPIRLRQGDRLVDENGTRWKVNGPRSYERSVTTGRLSPYYWLAVEATT